MSRGVNKVILIGNLGKDPEVQTFETYKKASFSLATTEFSRDRDGNEVQHTEWHNIVMWRGLAEIAEQFLHKGSQVYIEGKLRTRSYDNREGQKKFVTEIQADNMVLLGVRRDGNNDNFTAPSQAQTYSQPANNPPAHTAESGILPELNHPANTITPPMVYPTSSTDLDLPF